MASTLFELQQEAYASYLQNKDGKSLEPPMSFETWINVSANNFPLFQYWNKCLQLELLLLRFIQAQREADFELYKESIREILPWYFALDHIHYARWLSVHLRDLDVLNITSLSTFLAFNGGSFVTQKTTRKFSAIAHDQVHEQQNAILKGDGGLIGITESPKTLQRWTIAAPEITRMLTEMEESKQGYENHHEQATNTQNRFIQNVHALKDVMEDLGNPFQEVSSDLIAIDTKVVVREEGVDSVPKAEVFDKKQYAEFIETNLEEEATSFYEPLVKNNLQLFRSRGTRKLTKLKSKLASMKTDNRDGDLETFFANENHNWPPSLAENNEIRLANKAGLLESLERLSDPFEECPNVTCKIIDGAAKVQALDPRRSSEVIKTFEDYADRLFVPYIGKQLRIVTRVDVVWDITHKADERNGKIAANTSIPVNWKTFLKNDQNKETLYKYLSSKLGKYESPPDKVIITIFGERVLSSSSMTNVSEIQPCRQEEADYRMLLHTMHAFNEGHKHVLIHATDTDVVVLAVALIDLFTASDCCLWIAFGHAKNFRYISAHSISKRLGPDASWGLLLLHAISGHCVNICRDWQKDSFQHLDVFKRITPIKLSSAPDHVSDHDISQIERFVVLMYSRTSSFANVNAARKHMFSYGNRQFDKIPPTHCALVQHILRAVFQSGNIWGQMVLKNPPLPSPSEWGWIKRDGKWSPLWSTIAEASKGCQELIKCNCKSQRSMRCKCQKANLPCTHLWYCDAQCERGVAD
ncbi:LOW QUALITY PROTEIN: hypothetical protein MAR_003626 [Mya arenaria]|uniref:MYND-type domain-containing protein n=1 Tax=Mya arenaria TaxID=6604 RepID=A0ABY7G6L6_MYAAR|nr:LOW QUALITY PROTEIN: hypothetical protein MAR_003626 [Mya arenaria]